MSAITATGHLDMATGVVTITATLGLVTATLSFSTEADDQDVQDLAQGFYNTVDLVAMQMADEAIRRERAKRE